MRDRPFPEPRHIDERLDEVARLRSAAEDAARCVDMLAAALCDIRASRLVEAIKASPLTTVESS